MYRIMPDMVCLNDHHPMDFKEIMEYVVPLCSQYSESRVIFRHCGLDYTAQYQTALVPQSK